MLNKKTVDDLEDLQDKKVLVHCDFNVPLKEGVIQNCNRVDEAIPTIKKLFNQGTKIILRSHLGKPKGEPVPEMSLTPVTPVLSEKLGVEAKFVNDPRITGSEIRKVATELKDGEVLLLQNARYRGEETKLRDGNTASEAYAKELADLCDGVFVNDTFGTAHRIHCSNVGITRFTKENVVDYLMEKEIKLLRQAAESLARPFVVILDDVKVSDKINIINNLLDKVDTLIIGGDMTYTFAETQDQEIGNSLREADKLDYALEMIKKVEGEDVKLPLPVDHVEGEEFSDNIEHKIVDMIDAGWSGLDIGSKIIAFYKEALQGVKTVVWNGPMGVSESSNFAEGTLEVCRAVVGLVDAATIADGGDSVNTAKRLGFADKITHISTGGSASLGLLEGKELLGVAAVDNKA